MPDSVLSVVADSSPLPIAVVDRDGKLLLANRALRFLVPAEALDEVHGADRFGFGRRLILPTRAGGAVALEVISTLEETGSWILRGEDPVGYGRGLAETAEAFILRPNTAKTLLGLHLARNGQRAHERDQTLALLFLEPLEPVGEPPSSAGLSEPASLPPLASLPPSASLDERLRANLRSVDDVLEQADGIRAIVAVVEDGRGAEALATRLLARLGQPVEGHDPPRWPGVRIGLAHGREPDGVGLEATARRALEQAASSNRSIVAIACPRPA